MRRLLALLALFQDGLVTPVSRGENARKTLANERVVRVLLPLFELGPDAGATGQATLDLPLEAEWPRDDLGLVLFAQDPESMEILGATALHVGAAPIPSAAGGFASKSAPLPILSPCA